MRGEETKARHNERGVEVTGTSPNETEAQNTDASLFSLIVATVDLFVWSVWVVVTKLQHVVIDILCVFMYKGAKSFRHLNWIL